MHLHIRSVTLAKIVRINFLFSQYRGFRNMNHLVHSLLSCLNSQQFNIILILIYLDTGLDALHNSLWSRECSPQFPAPCTLQVTGCSLPSKAALRDSEAADSLMTGRQPWEGKATVDVCTPSGPVLPLSSQFHLHPLQLVKCGWTKGPWP